MMHIPHRANHSGSVEKFGQRLDKGEAVDIIWRFVSAKASENGPLSRCGCSAQDSRTTFSQQNSIPHDRTLLIDIEAISLCHNAL